MPFDPDKYLSKKTGFDPDAYLAKKEEKPSQMEAVVEGAKEGASFGFLDELGA
ncbi:MAG: hypothetical protein GWN64_04820, partial [Candidatus Thorarchaeota archaeon]|nr:hypothetical protein [Candidatus Thorarchaeota archaeon]